MNKPNETKSSDNQNRKYFLLGAGTLLIAVAGSLNTYYTSQVESKLLERILKKDAEELTQCIENRVSVVISHQERYNRVRYCLEEVSK